MSLVIDDSDVCPICMAYYDGNGMWCANGHVRKICPICNHKEHVGVCNKRVLFEYASGDYMMHDDYICKCNMIKVNK